LAAFVRLAWPNFDPLKGTPLHMEPHIKLICAHYEAVSRGEIKELVVNVPPGCTKSLLTNVFWPAWDTLINPGRRWIFTSYDEDLALRDARWCRNLIQSEWFQARWGVGKGGINVHGGDKAAAGFWETTGGGSRFSTMMGGAVTGFHCHFLVCDDPLKPKEIQAGGDSAREKLEACNLTWDQTFSSRSADPATFAKVIIMQRLHHGDLAGKVIARGAQALILPMEFEPHRKYTSKWGDDWRTEEGELLAPARFPQEVVDARREIMTARDFAAQFQQRPSPEDGSLFLREHFKRRWTMLPHMMRMILSVDASFKGSKKADFFVCQCWGMKSATEFYLIDQAKLRTGFWGGLETIRTMRKKWPQVTQVIVEARANGDAIIETLQKQMTGVLPIQPKGGKESRANSAEPIYRSNVYFPDDKVAPWMDEFISSHLAFPVGEHDDEIDCATQAVLFLQSKTHYGVRKQAMENVRGGGRLAFFRR
jgi:predicted phage terminase large subunit-like protein